MPETVQSIILLLVIMPGLIGYLVFAKLSNNQIEDSVQKISYIALLNIIAVTIFGFLTNFSYDYVQQENIGQALQFFSKSGFLLTLISSISAVILATLINKLNELDIFNRFGITKKANAEAVLSEVIKKYPKDYFKVRYKSGGYILGHPRIYSLNGQEDALFMDNASRRPARVLPNADQPPAYDIEGPGLLIVNFDDISCIEVLNGVYP